MTDEANWSHRSTAPIADQVLELLARQPMSSPRDVAAAFDIKPMDAGFLLAKLELDGHVEFIIDTEARTCGYRLKAQR